jgi:hypothetical protein
MFCPISARKCAMRWRRGNGLILKTITATDAFMAAAPGIGFGSRFMLPPPD